MKQSHRRSTWKLWVGEVLMTKRQFRRWLPGFKAALARVTARDEAGDVAKDVVRNMKR